MPIEAPQQQQCAPVLTPALTDRRLLWWAGIASALLFLGLISNCTADPDVWHELALVRESLAQRHFLTADVFAYTPTLSPVVHHEWGAGLAAYLAMAVFGPSGLIILKFAAAAVLAFFTLRCARVLRGEPAAILTLAPLASVLALVGFVSTVRAQVYSFAFSAILLFLLERDRRRHNRLWILGWLLLFIIWLNVHGGFVVGFAFVAVHLVERMLNRERWRHLALLLGGMALCLPVNPYGLAYLPYLRNALSMSRPLIVEWRPLWESPLLLGFFFVAVVIGAYALFTRSRKERRFQGELLLAATAVESLLHTRFLPFFAFAFLCYVSAALGERLRPVWIRQKLVVAAAYTYIAVVGLLALGSHQWRLDVAENRDDRRSPLAHPAVIYPVAAVNFLRQTNFHGNLVTPLTVGGYVSWELYPAVKVSFDGRYEVAYPAWVSQRMLDVYSARDGWQATLASFGTEAVLVPSDTPLAQAMPQVHWKQIYADKEFRLYCRPDASPYCLGFPTLQGPAHPGSN